MPDGTVNTKETVTENKDGLNVVTETLTSTSTSVTLVKVTSYDINGTIVNAYAEIHTGLSDTDSESSADTIVPENYFQNIKSSGIYIVDIYIEKITVDIAREKLSPEVLVNIVLPDPDGVVIRKVIVRKESIKSAKESGKKFVASLQCKNLAESYTVTIPKSELKKINKEMKKDTNILVKTGKVSTKKINRILSSNKLGKNGAYTVKIANNNTKGGIKVTTPVMIPSLEAGDKAYVYCYNKKTGKLEEIANNKLTVTKKGEASIEGFSGNTYVITKRALKGNKVITLLNKTRASLARNSVKAGKRTRVKLNLGKGLILRQSVRSSTPYAKQAAVVTYKSSAPDKVTVSKDGTITAKEKGEAQIIVKIKLAGGKVKNIKKTIVVE